MWLGPLTMISVTVSSRRNGSIGPKPVKSSAISSTRRARSSRVTTYPCALMTRSTIPSSLLRVSAGPVVSRSALKAPITSLWSWTRTPRRNSSRAWPGPGFAGAGGSTGTIASGFGTSGPWFARPTRWSSDMTYTSLESLSGPGLVVNIRLARASNPPRRLTTGNSTPARATGDGMHPAGAPAQPESPKRQPGGFARTTGIPSWSRRGRRRSTG